MTLSVVTEETEPKTLRRLLALDPGDVHAGVAEFLERGEPGDWECTWAREMAPEAATDYLAGEIAVGRVDVLVMEEFRLYLDKARAQAGSTMLTAQMVGVVRFIVRTYNGRGGLVRVPGEELGGGVGGGAAHATLLVEQGASIQKPTRAMLKEMGVKSESKGNAHALSAELHGFHWVLRDLESNEQKGW